MLANTSPLRSALVLGWAAAALASQAAWGQSAANGQLLYNRVIVVGQNSCSASACHGSAPSRRLNRIQNGVVAATIKSGVAGIAEMNFLSGHLSDSDYNDLAAFIASSVGGTATYLTVAAAPLASLSGTSVAFGTVTVGSTSPARTITLTNAGTAALTVSQLSLTGVAFGLSHGCPMAPATLAVGSACTLSLTFSPTVAGGATGTVTVVSNATPATQTITLSGSGAAAAVPALAWSGGTAALTLASATVGSTGSAQTLTLQNTGSSGATLQAITLTGADAADFTTGGTCTAGSTLTAGSACTVTVALMPVSAGNKAAALQVTSTNASNPPAVALTGTATAPVSPAPTPAPSPSPVTGVTPTSASGSNAGGGGCSLVDPARAAPTDPLLWLLALGAAAVLAWRRHTGAAPSRR